MFKVNNKQRRSGVFIVNFDHNSHHVLEQLDVGHQNEKILTHEQHCVKSVRIPSFSVPCFPTFRLNAEKCRPEKLRMRTLLTQCNLNKQI